MRNVTVEELHLLLLNIAKEFHHICEKHGVPYYMLGGTMLGAVRHKGFIPWDDDMDFGVPREYFNNLIKILNEELHAPYHVLTMDNSDALVVNFIKIEDTRTITSELFKENVRNTYGVNIDIFPLDRCDGRKDILSKNLLIQTLLKVQLYRFLCVKLRPWHKKIVAYSIKAILVGIKKRTIINFIEKHLLTKGEYYANHYGAWGCKEIIPIPFFGRGGYTILRMPSFGESRSPTII